MASGSRYVSNHDPDPDRTDNSDVFVVAAKAGLDSKEADHLDRARWRPAGVVAGFKVDRVHPRAGDKAVCVLAKQAGGGHAGWKSELSRGEIRSRRKPADIFTRMESLTTWWKTTAMSIPRKSSWPATASSASKTQQGVVQTWESEAGHTAVLYTNDSDPGELYALEDGNLRKLTHHNDALMAELNLVPTENIEYTSPDGTDVHGLLTKPADWKQGSPVPMILFIHGGPNGQDAHSFDFLRQWLATKGYAELNINYRGGGGRGQDYAKVIAADWGHYEVVDLKAGVDKAIAMGVADPNKMCVTGWSYGGILTDYMIASDSRFKCAISGAGTAFTVSFYGVDQYIQQYDNEIGPPWKDLDTYIKISYPFLHADKLIHTPTMFMGGTNDMNVPLRGRRADVPGAQVTRRAFGVSRVSRSVSRLHQAQLHQGPLRALVGLVGQVDGNQSRRRKSLRKNRRNPRQSSSTKVGCPIHSAVLCGMGGWQTYIVRATNSRQGSTCA